MTGTPNRDPAIDFGRPIINLRLFGGRLSGRLDLRTVGFGLAILVAALLVAAISLASGVYSLPAGEIARALFGTGSPEAALVVLEWRLPRVALGLCIGAALGASGAIFQSLTRNPLGSPDVLGFDAGAQSGVLLAGLWWGAGRALALLGAVLGGCAAAGLVILVSLRRGGFDACRVILTGIGIGAMLTAFNTWLLLRVQREVAMTASVWAAGSLNGVTPQAAAVFGSIILLLLPAAWLTGHMLRQIEMGDEIATALGIRLAMTRLLAASLAVMLAATATAAAGPIAFIALTAPQLAARLIRAPGVAPLPAAAMGALLLTAADYIARNLLRPTEIPVGIVALSVGGLYLAWLLLREGKRR